MTTNRIHSLCALLLVCAASAWAQSTERAASSAGLYLTAKAKSDVLVPFSLQAEGKRFKPTWGLDMAWEDANNVRRGVNHMGKDNVGIGRTSFRTVVPMASETALASDHTTHLRTRANAFNLVSDTLPLIMNSDCGAGVNSYYSQNKQADVAHWCQMLNAHVQWMLDNTRHPVLGVSPFNEPDFSVEQGTRDNFLAIARQLRTDYPLFADRVISGGNTLNCDQALPWYEHLSAQLDWGNTHQLAGSFDNYAGFYERLVADGKVGCNDEMHNVGEAMIGLEYGMTVGIWWGFDSRARGEFCDISRNGVRLAYGEHRNNWTAASVYRHDATGRVKAFLGSSERQAVTTTYEFLSLDRPVYYDGYGPCYERRMEMPGGARGSYQNGQTNAERVVDVTWGDDVQPYVIDGTYKIMNKATLGVVAEYGSSGSNTNVSQAQYTGQKTQQWNVRPVSPRIGGDYSFYDITSVYDGKHIDVLNYSLLSGENLIAYPNATPSSNQQWYLEYAGDGYFYIRNRNSALYLTLASNSTANGTNICQQSLAADAERQLWRIIPVDAGCELQAPAQPTGLTATPRSHSVLLQWEPNGEPDLDGYTVLRAEQGTDQWNTIARQLAQPQFVDNCCQPGQTYVYRVKATDRSANQSACSDSVAAAPTGEPALIAHWTFDGDCLDATDNQLDAAPLGEPVFRTGHGTGSSALSLAGTATSFVQLPYTVASSAELTVACWVSVRNTSLVGQRLFDFGNGPDHSFYLTTNAGSGMRFVAKDGATELVVDGSRLPLISWRHVAVTIGSEKTTLYVDGKEVGSGDTAVSPARLRPLLNYIGRGQGAADAALNAYVDDFRVYNYALTPTAVAQLAGGVDTRVGTAAASIDGDPVAVYSAGGQRRPALQRGLNIVRQAGSTAARKVINK